MKIIATKGTGIIRAANGFRLHCRKISPVIIAVIGALCLSPTVMAADTLDTSPLGQSFRSIEQRLGGRVGAYILDTGTGQTWTHRAEERFPLNSTVKAFACAAVLARVDRGQEDLSRTVTFTKSDVVFHSPVVEKVAGGPGMSVADVCAAAMVQSDNAAANAALKRIGGPAGFTAFMRSIGDDKTRLDRWEPEMNEARPGDPRDTTTPATAAASLQRLVLGDVLASPSRQRLTDWLLGNAVSGPLLRAGLPAGWRVADRTGAGGHGSRSIIAVIWPPERPPVIAAVYLTGAKGDLGTRNRAIAEVGTALAATLGK